MSSIKLRLAFFVILLSVILLRVGVAAADNTPNYQKGTITISGVNPKSYDLKGADKGYQISHCGDFQNGQDVDYRVKEDKVYISHPGGKEYKCSIEATMEHWSGVEPPPITFVKGTIEGFDTRRDTSVSGGGTVGNSSFPASSHTRIVKVYRLRGTDLTYKIDYCGMFQAGQFTAGQEVEYRLAGNRLYIRHDNDKEYDCQVEGTERPESARSAAKPAQPGDSSANSTPPAATPATSTASLSITSIPDGADIEVDGNFFGNTPSDLKVAEGEHSITVKKAGYRTWERKMTVVAGSSIRLNAEMEKTTTP